MAQVEKTIENLQTAVSLELAAVNQYLLHILAAESWGLDKLVIKMRKEMLEELGHAEEFARRMIYLGGVPEMKASKVPHFAASLSEMFDADLVEENDAIGFYTSAANDADDIGTRALFERTALEEEGHMAWIALQISLLERLGEPAFTAMQIDNSAPQ